MEIFGRLEDSSIIFCDFIGLKFVGIDDCVALYENQVF
jgi:hypothetical protein